MAGIQNKTVGTDFTNTGISDIRSSGSPSSGLPTSAPDITTGVNKQATASVINSVASNVAKVATAIGPLYAKNQTSKFVGSFTQEQLKIANAVDQGLMSSSEGRLRMRANFTKYSADNPSFVGELAEAQKTIVGTTGLGKIVADGTEEEKQMIALQTDALKAGFINPHMNSEEKQSGVDNYIEYRGIVSTLELESKRLANQKGNMEVNNLLRQEKQTNAITQLSNVWFETKSNDVDSWTRALGQGVDPVELITMADRAIVEMNQVIGQVGNTLSKEDVERFTGPTLQMLENFKNFASGKDSKETYEQNNEAIIAQRQYGLLLGKDVPKDVAGLVARQSLLNKGVNVNTAQGTTAMFQLSGKLFAENGKKGSSAVIGGAGTSEEEKNSRKDYYKDMGDIMKNINSGALDGPEAETYKKQVEGVFKSINIYQLATESPAQYKAFADWAASPEFFKFTQRNPEAVPEELRRSVSDVIKREYVDVALPILKKEYEGFKLNLIQPGSVGGTSDDLIDAKGDDFKAIWRGNELMFELSDKYKTPPRRPVLPRALRQTRKLNEKLAKPINRLIKLSAHLEGGNNYQEVWERDFAPRMGLKMQEAQKPGEPRAQVNEQPAENFSTENFSTENFKTGDQKTDLNTPLIDEGITEGLMDRLSFIESSNNPNAVSSAGALGLYQIMPDTAEQPGFGVRPLATGRDVMSASPEEQRRFSREYLNALEAKYGDTALALAAYNAGPGVVDDYLAGVSNLPKETQEYIRKFNLQMPVNPETSFLDSVKDFVVEPAAAGDRINTSYTISSGDTLGKIAKKFGMSVSDLARANSISDPNKIRVGQKLKVNGGIPLPNGEVVKVDTKKIKSGSTKEATKEAEKVSKGFFDSLGLDLTHAKVVMKFMNLGIVEKISGKSLKEVSKDFRKKGLGETADTIDENTTITEKDLSPEVIAEIKRVALKAKKSGKSSTQYGDFSETAKKIVEGRGSYQGSFELIKDILSSFNDPASAAAFTIGRTSTSSIKKDKNGDWIIEDVYDFPSLGKRKENDDAWISFHKLFGPEGLFNVKEGLKMRINLGKDE